MTEEWKYFLFGVIAGAIIDIAIIKYICSV